MRKIALLTLLNLTPVLAFAATGTFGSGLDSYLSSVLDFINRIIIPLIIAAAVVMFIWGMVKYFIFGGSNTEKQEEGKQLLIWGFVGFVVIFSIYGIIRLLTTALGVNNPELPLPTVPTGR